MTPVTSLAVHQGAQLAKRRTVTIELPEFAIRALEHRAEIANAGAESPDDIVTFNDVAEWHLLSPLSVREIPSLETAVPGFTAAFAAWLFETTYRPADE
jgi:hypothetical protein